MITFDKIKIITKIAYVTNINIDKFMIISKKGNILYYKYQQDKPYNLLVMINYQHNELILEFTGKILLDKYPSLINRDNIKDCLSEINKLDICSLDTDAIIQDSEVVKCDVTKDVEFEYIDKILKNIRPNIANHNKWKDKPYRGKEGITLENIAKTPKYKKRLIIYDKAKELISANNNEFLSACSNSEKIISYFKNKIRFELNINTMEQIRQLLNVPNNNLITVLNSCSNPILSVVDEALVYSDFQETPMTLKDYEHSLLLKECNYDMSVVEAKVRSLVSKNTYIKRVMQPYKELYTQMQASSCQRLNIRELVA